MKFLVFLPGFKPDTYLTQASLVAIKLNVKTYGVMVALLHAFLTLTLDGDEL
jgi:hypothetical protein